MSDCQDPRRVTLMDISRVIEQLRRYCPELGGRVGGAADFETGVESVIAITDPATGKFVYPAAVVIPLEDEAGSTDLLDGNLQTVTETIGVIVEFDASADRRGQAAVSQVKAMKYALFRALLGWVIDPERGARGLTYAGGELLTFDRARLFWMYRMSFDAMVSDADGFVPRGDPLCGARRGVNVLVIGQSNAVNSLSDGAWNLCAQGLAWDLGAASYGVIGGQGGVACTAIGGYGIYNVRQPPGTDGIYIPGNFLADPGDGSNPGSWGLGADGLAVEACLVEWSVADLADIAAIVWPWFEACHRA